MSTSARADFADAVAATPSCALDEAGVRAQRERHARLAPSVIGLTRADGAVVIGFAPGFDREALMEMVAVEEQCCPFFSFSFAEEERRLEVTVEDEEMAPALDVIAGALASADWS